MTVFKRPILKIKLLFLICLITLNTFPSYAQLYYDSLNTIIESASGIEKVDLLNKISKESVFDDLVYSMTLAERAQAISDSLNYMEGRLQALYNEGFIEYLRGNLQGSINKLENALPLIDEASDYGLVRDIYLQLAKSYEEINSYDRGLRFYQLCYELCNRYEDNSGIGLAELGIAQLYFKMNEFRLAIEHSKSSFMLFESVDNISGMARANIEMAHCFQKLEISDSVRKYLDLAERLIESNDQLIELYKARVAFFEKSDLDSAIYYQKVLVSLVSDLNRIYEMEGLMLKLSDLYANAGDFENASYTYLSYEKWRDSLKIKGSANNLTKNQDRIRTAIEGKYTQDEPADREGAFLQNDSIFYFILIGCILLAISVPVWLVFKYKHQKKSLTRLRELEDEILKISEEIKKKDHQLLDYRENQEIVKKQMGTLRKMFSEKEGYENVEDQIRDLHRKIAENINADIVGLWIFHKENNSIVNYDEYNARRDSHRSGDTILLKEYPLYREALVNSHLMEAEKAQEDPRMIEFRESRLLPNKIISRMDVPLFWNNTFIGVIWIESLNPKNKWSDEDKRFITTISELVVRIMKDRILKLSSFEIASNKGVSDYNEENFIQTIAHSSKTIFGIRDQQGDIQWITGPSFEIAGYENHELMGANWMDIIPDDYRDFVRDKYERWINDPGKKSHVIEIRCKDATQKFMVEDIWATSKLDAGYHIFFSIRQLSNWSSELEESIDRNQVLHGFINSLETPALLLNYKLAIQIANRSFMAITNHSLNDIEGKYLKDILIDSTESETLLEDILQNLNSNKEIYVISTHAQVLKSCEKAPYKWRISVFNVDHDFYISCELLDQLPELSVDHERVLDHPEDLPIANRRAYHHMAFSFFIKELLQKHDEFLKKSGIRIEFEQFAEMRLVSGTFSDFCEGLAHMISSAHESRINFHQEISVSHDALPNPAIFMIIILELVQNASRAIKLNGDIYLKIKKVEDKIHLSMIDTGEGMNQQKRSQVFVPFYTESGSVVERFGLGLSMVRELVTIHKGTIKVIAQPMKGTEIRISWPFANPPL